jgi:predicted S18 family serine protease
MITIFITLDNLTITNMNNLVNISVKEYNKLKFNELIDKNKNLDNYNKKLLHKITLLEKNIKEIKEEYESYKYVSGLDFEHNVNRCKYEAKCYVQKADKKVKEAFEKLKEKEEELKFIRHFYKSLMPKTFLLKLKYLFFNKLQ